jgi:hypothetical protein
MANLTHEIRTNKTGDHMHAALDVNIPSHANAIVTTFETVDSISSLSTRGIGAGYRSHSLSS